VSHQRAATEPSTTNGTVVPPTSVKVPVLPRNTRYFAHGIHWVDSEAAARQIQCPRNRKCKNRSPSNAMKSENGNGKTGLNAVHPTAARS